MYSWAYVLLTVLFYLLSTLVLSGLVMLLLCIGSLLVINILKVFLLSNCSGYSSGSSGVHDKGRVAVSETIV